MFKGGVRRVVRGDFSLQKGVRRRLLQEETIRIFVGSEEQSRPLRYRGRETIAVL